ncbi:MAG: dephospho-CoA kinase [Vicinamibacterales bacterium]
MLTAALTGGIATGKSYVRARLERLGAACLDADQIAHGIMAPGTEAAQAIAERFGSAVLAPDGSVNRSVLGPLVFRDDEARRSLEAIVHPAVWRNVHVALRALKIAENPRVAIVEIPLVYETGHAAEFDRIIATICAPPVQIDRLVERGLSEDEAHRRVAAQMPSEEKARLADYVVDTGQTFEETDRQVDAVWRSLVQASTSAVP